ncbi:MAG: DUF4440 domain-containing protein, partial [Candidatus Eremiobacterota bacterium]
MRIVLLLLLLTATGFAEPTHPAWATLENQKAAWNRGDLDTFLDGYLRVPELTFTSGANLVQGFDAV